jgi:hypothetical protein
MRCQLGGTTPMIHLHTIMQAIWRPHRDALVAECGSQRGYAADRIWRRAPCRGGRWNYASMILRLVLSEIQ